MLYYFFSSGKDKFPFLLYVFRLIVKCQVSDSSDIGLCSYSCKKQSFVKMKMATKAYLKEAFLCKVACLEAVTLPQENLPGMFPR